MTIDAWKRKWTSSLAKRLECGDTSRRCQGVRKRRLGPAHSKRFAKSNATLARSMTTAYAGTGDFSTTEGSAAAVARYARKLADLGTTKRGSGLT